MEPIQTPPSKCLGERSNVNRGRSDRKIWLKFIGELELCNEDSIIIGGEPSLRGNNLKFLSGVRLSAAEASLMRRFVTGKLKAYLRTDFAPIFSHWGNHQCSMCRGT